MFDKDSLHHAYFIEGERVLVLAELEAFLEQSFNIVRHGNPDVHYVVYESFGIDESRELQGMQSMKPIVSDKKIFIVVTDSITSEAQNSLLKVFEEPTPGTHFFIISSSKRILLPTLRSRVVIISHASSYEHSLAEETKHFISFSPKERLAFVAEIIEEKNKGKAEAFLLALVSELRGNSLEQATPEKVKAIKEILSLSEYLKDRSSSLKLILERVSLLRLY